MPQVAPVPPAYAPAPPSAASPTVQVPKRRNQVGSAAFVVALSAFLSPAIAVIGGFVAIGRVPMTDDSDVFNVLLFGAIGAGIGCAVGIVAVVLGIVALVLRDRKRLWGVLGVVLAVIAIVVGWMPLVAFIASIGYE
jgi:hypothetical protein